MVLLIIQITLVHDYSAVILVIVLQ